MLMRSFAATTCLFLESRSGFGLSNLEMQDWELVKEWVLSLWLNKQNKSLILTQDMLPQSEEAVHNALGVALSVDGPQVCPNGPGTILAQ